MDLSFFVIIFFHHRRNSLGDRAFKSALPASFLVILNNIKDRLPVSACSLPADTLDSSRGTTKRYVLLVSIFFSVDTIDIVNIPLASLTSTSSARSLGLYDLAASGADIFVLASRSVQRN
jgi:hypothetical protein